MEVDLTSSYYPVIFVLGLAGLGKYTERGAGMIVRFIFGGACFTPVYPLFNLIDK